MYAEKPSWPNSLIDYDYVECGQIHMGKFVRN